MPAAAHFPARRSRQHQHGLALVEFAVAALPVLLLGMGGLELSHWHFVRQGISLALLDAGRAAITAHADPERIITAFETALAPLHVSARHGAAARVGQALAQRSQALAGPPWLIEVLSPSASAFADFADPALALPLPAINNHYLAEQAARHGGQSGQAARGAVSGQTFYQANTLVLRLSWPHRPAQAWLRRLLQGLGDARGNYRQRALAAGYLPMARQLTLLMQSHPMQWPDHGSGKVIYRSETGATGLACRGWLCHAHATADSSAMRDGGPASAPTPSDALARTNAPSAGPTAAVPAGTLHPSTAAGAPAPPPSLPAFAAHDANGSTSNATDASVSPGGAVPANANPADGNAYLETGAEAGLAPDDGVCGVVLCCL